jgi:hypothetical protein
MAMSEAEHLRAQAVRCRRIAGETDDDPRLAEDLNDLAQDYETRAALAARRQRAQPRPA